MKKHILLIGIGQLGCSVAELYAGTAKKENAVIHVIEMDTDEELLGKTSRADIICMAHPCNLGDVLDNLDTDILKYQFPCDRENDYTEYFETLSMNRGSGGWRMKALLSFNYHLSTPKGKQSLHNALDAIISDADDDGISIDIYIVASLAGGTGSGLFLPVALYVKKYLSDRSVTLNSTTALLAMPEICEDMLSPEQLVKARANAYAAIREINAINLKAEGKAPSFSLRIGDSRDPHMGLLYDSENESSTLPENRPFNYVYLFNRTPGTRSVRLSIDTITEAAISLSNLDNLPHENSTDTIFGGFSITRSIYPEQSIVSYISLRSLSEAASDGMMPTIKKLSEEYSRREKLAAYNPDLKERKAQKIARALLNCADSEGDEETNEYFRKLSTAIDSAFLTQDSVSLKNHINSETARLKNKKNRKSKIFGGEERRRVLINQIKNCSKWINDFYSYGIDFIANSACDFAKNIFESDPDTSLINNLFTTEGEINDPLTTLLRLCTVHAKLEAQIESSDLTEKISSGGLEPEAIPEWILAANNNIHMRCQYDTGMPDRFMTVIHGNTKNVGKSRFDSSLFCFDLENCYLRMNEAFRIAFIPYVLEKLETYIEFYFDYLEAFSCAYDELSADVSVALRRCAVNSPCINYVGSTEGEKLALYEKYRLYLSENGIDSAIALRLGKQLGRAAADVITTTSTSDSKIYEDSIYNMLRSLGGELESECRNSEFYSRFIDKDILEILLTQDGKNGADSADLALRKAFISNSHPILYTVPNTREDFIISRKIQNRVIAALPSSSYEYIRTNIDKFKSSSVNGVLNDLLIEAGEYYGEPIESTDLGKFELHMQRLLMGLSPYYVEAFCEDSQYPDYYKAYKKALALASAQLTALWDPHVVVGLSGSDTLPFVSGSFKPDR